mgnify:FL=1
MYRNLPVMAQLCTELCKRERRLADPSVMQSYYSAGTMIALIVTALLTRKIKDVRFILVYPVICLATMVVVLVGQTKPLMIAGAFIIGWAGAGGLYRS